MKDINIRIANNNDSSDIFTWRNDELSRKMSRDSNEVSWQQHETWYQQKMMDKNSLLLICEDATTEVKIGVVRFDFADDNNEEAEISINLSSMARGQGYAKICLQSAIAYMVPHYPQCQKIIADIKTDNEASKKSFEYAGFEVSSIDDGFYRCYYFCK